MTTQLQMLNIYVIFKCMVDKYYNIYNHPKQVTDSTIFVLIPNTQFIAGFT